MNTTIARFALATLCLSAAGLAHAQSSLSASFSLLDGHLPFLKTGNPNFDGAHSLNGQWASSTRIDARADSRDLLSTTYDPVTGEAVQNWGQWNHSDNKGKGGGGPLSMGETWAFIQGPNETTHTNASASVSFTGVSARVQRTDRDAEARTRGSWDRDFWLDPAASFTFAGIAKLDVTGATDPLAALTRVEGFNGASFAQVTLGDALNRMGATIGATLYSWQGSLANTFSYDVNPEGLLSLTITNHGTAALHGNLNTAAFVNIGTPVLSDTAAPIPEPGTWLLMIGGVMGVAAQMRRRGASVPAPALAA